MEVSQNLVIWIMTCVCLLPLLVWGDSSGRGEEERGGGEGAYLAPVLEMLGREGTQW